MTYSDIPQDDLIILTIGFVGRGLSVPQEIRDILGPDLLEVLEHPEITRHDNQEP